MTTLSNKFRSVHALIASFSFTPPELHRLHFEISQLLTRRSKFTITSLFHRPSSLVITPLDTKIQHVIDLIATLKFSTAELHRLRFDIDENGSVGERGTDGDGRNRIEGMQEMLKNEIWNGAKAIGDLLGDVEEKLQNTIRAAGVDGDRNDASESDVYFDARSWRGY